MQIIYQKYTTMAKKIDDMKLLARITFAADKMVRNLKKCLEKKGINDYVTHPAIEVETGLMIATNGHILAATKLKDYRCELGEGVLVVNGTRMLPVEVLAMKGMVTVDIMGDGQGKEVVRVSDEQGNTVEQELKSRYPNWRGVMPWDAGYPIDVDAKAWSSAVSSMIKAMSNDDAPAYSVRLYGERDSKTLRMSHYDWRGDETEKQDVAVGRMPYKMFVTFAGKRLQTILAFEPTAMRFMENTRAAMFYSADTLMLLMPVLINDDSGMRCKVDSKDFTRFDLEKWMKGEVAVEKAKPKAASKREERDACIRYPECEQSRPKAKAKKQAARAAEIPQHTGPAEPTFAERLREALLKHYRQAA